jgi:hypothetical protein
VPSDDAKRLDLTPWKVLARFKHFRGVELAMTAHNTGRVFCEMIKGAALAKETCAFDDPAYAGPQGQGFHDGDECFFPLAAVPPQRYRYD